MKLVDKDRPWASSTPRRAWRRTPRVRGSPPGANPKRTLFDHRGSRFFTYFVGTSAAVAVMLICQRHKIPAGGMAAGLILIGMTCTELAVASFADAMEAARHHLLFYALFDMLLLTGICLVGRFFQHFGGETLRSPLPTTPTDSLSR